MKNFVCAAIAAISLSLTSCGSMGMIYTDYTAAGTATSNTLGTKVGQSQHTSVLGLIAIGDSGINAAARNAGIKKVSHVDVRQFSVLGLFSSVTTYVYGE